jgi:hypothetical protein
LTGRRAEESGGRVVLGTRTLITCVISNICACRIGVVNNNLSVAIRSEEKDKE